MSAIPRQENVRTFLSICIELYEVMLAEIKTSKINVKEEGEMIQTCFEIAGTYKEQLNQAVRNYQFPNKSDEIFFFKKIKPLFTAEVEFYTYLYHIFLFKTREIEADKIELARFYKRQLLKKEKLKKENPDFIKYIEENANYADLQWFTRKKQTECSSLFDALMGRYIAIEKFEIFLKDLMNREIS